MYSGKKRRGVRAKERVRRRDENKEKALAFTDTLQTHWQILQETFCNPLEARSSANEHFL